MQFSVNNVDFKIPQQNICHKAERQIVRKMRESNIYKARMGHKKRNTFLSPLYVNTECELVKESTPGRMIYLYNQSFNERLNPNVLFVELLRIHYKLNEQGRNLQENGDRPQPIEPTGQ